MENIIKLIAIPSVHVPVIQVKIEQEYELVKSILDQIIHDNVAISSYSVKADGIEITVIVSDDEENEVDRTVASVIEKLNGSKILNRNYFVNFMKA